MPVSDAPDIIASDHFDGPQGARSLLRAAAVALAVGGLLIIGATHSRHPAARAVTHPQPKASPGIVPAVLLVTHGGRTLAWDGRGLHRIDVPTFDRVVPPSTEQPGTRSFLLFPEGWSPVDRRVWACQEGGVAFAHTSAATDGARGHVKVVFAIVVGDGTHVGSIVPGSLGAAPQAGLSVRGDAVLFTAADREHGSLRLEVWWPGSLAQPTDQFLPMDARFL